VITYHNAAIMRGAINKDSIKEILMSQENANIVRGMYEARAGEVRPPNCQCISYGGAHWSPKRIAASNRHR
jgi:hypothetical protein